MTKIPKEIVLIIGDWNLFRIWGLIIGI